MAGWLSQNGYIALIKLSCTLVGKQLYLIRLALQGLHEDASGCALRAWASSLVRFPPGLRSPPVLTVNSVFIQYHHKYRTGALTSSVPPSTAVSPSPVKFMLTQALRSHGTRMASLSPWDKRFSSFLVGKLRLCAWFKALLGV